MCCPDSWSVNHELLPISKARLPRLENREESAPLLSQTCHVRCSGQLCRNRDPLL